MENKKNSALPILRFPEFSGEWEEVKFRDICKSARLGGNYDNSTSKTSMPVIKMGNLGRGKIILNTVQYLLNDSEYNIEDILKSNDLLFNTRNTLDLVGKVAIWRNELPISVYNSNLLRMYFDEMKVHSNIFMNYCFNSCRVLKQLKGYATGTTSVAAIYTKDLNNLLFRLPILTEQSKVGMFLSAIDERLELLVEKKKMLEAYKKGVMQKLFSQELRFKDENGNEYPEWEEKTLGDVCEFLDNKRKPIKDSDRDKIHGGYPYYGASGIIDYVNDYIFDDELILLGEDGANIIMRSSRLAFKVKGKIWVNNHAHVLKPINNAIGYICEYLESIKYDKYNTGTAQPKLNRTVCESIPIPTPTLPEQQKIANFLSALDDKITAMDNKITHTQQYKKALLQQMFV